MNNQTILIVDDEPITRTLMEAILDPHYTVRTADSGTQALEMISTQLHPDLILLDVIMPMVDGYHVLLQLKGNPDTRDIPVIFVSSMENEEDIENGLALGAVDYVKKPVNPGLLMAKVKSHLPL